MILTFAILIFCATALLVAGVLLHRGGAGARALAERLRDLGRNNDEGSEQDFERDSRLSVMPWLDGVLRSLNVGQHLELMLYQSGMSMRAGVLVLLIGTAAMAGYMAGLLLLHRLMPALVFMVLLGVAPYCYVRFRKFQRMRAFAREFPDALDLLVSGLRAGLSFSAAMQIVAEESPEPVCSEFAITVEEQALGLEFRDALVHLTERVDVLDLRFFVTAVLLHRETGGNLAEVLTKTAALIRERFRVLGDIQTFTAQGKLTGVILVCLPILVGLFTAIVSPDYFRPMLQTHGGQVALWYAAVLQIVGVLVIFKIVNIKV